VPKDVNALVEKSDHILNGIPVPSSQKLAWRPSVPSISFVYCKVTVWLLTFNVIHYMAAFWAVFTFGGSGPAFTAHGSLDKKFKFKSKWSQSQSLSWYGYCRIFTLKYLK
jgi:hypothetical protein